MELVLLWIYPIFKSACFLQHFFLPLNFLVIIFDYKAQKYPYDFVNSLFNQFQAKTQKLASLNIILNKF